MTNLEAFRDKNVLVLGDLMIDAYVHGQVHRISPEAPVPVLLSNKKENRLGGAANVALNLKKLQANVHLCGLIGDDAHGHLAQDLLQKEGLSTSGIFVEASRKTTTKTRVLENGKHLLRIDEEDLYEIGHQTEQKILQFLTETLPQTDVLILQDYNKGLFGENIIQKSIQYAHKYGTKVAVDPKLKNFLQFKQVDLFKPNLKELKEGLQWKKSLDKISDIQEAIWALHNKIKAKKIMVTLSEKGILIFENEQFFHLPAHPRNIVDVSGAGDAVISVAALLLALGCSAKEMARLSNLAGGLVCEKVGVAPISFDELAKHAAEGN